MLTHSMTLILSGALVALIFIYLIFYTIKKSRSQKGHTVDYVNEQIYVGNLPYQVDEDDIRSYFSRFGKILNTKVVKNYKTGRSKGFAFVTYTSFNEAKKALIAHGKVLKGRNMVVRIAKPR